MAFYHPFKTRAKFLKYMRFIFTLVSYDYEKNIEFDCKNVIKPNKVFPCILNVCECINLNHYFHIALYIYIL